MNHELPSVAVVICCFTEERWSLIRTAVDSVLAQQHPADEIIVVVDHNDLLCERLRAELHPDGVRVIPNDGPRGLSGTRNTGMKHAASEVVAFLDDDAAAAPAWLGFLLPPYLDERVIGVGGQVVPRFEVARPGWLPPELDWVIGCTYEGHRTSRGPVRNLIGANMSLRREVFDRVGGFSSDLGRSTAAPAGCEETELCMRATRALDGEVFYEPDALVRHFVPASRTTKEYLRARCRAEGRSKAIVTRLSGKVHGDLRAEARYATHTLPKGLRRELTDVLKGRRAGAWSRALTLVSALVMTTLGFLGEWRLGWLRRPAPRRAFVTANTLPPSAVQLREPPLVSVIVATRDRPVQLARALDALAELDYPSFEVVVVENAARTLATAQAVRQHAGADGHVRYVSEPKPGLARAHNAGTKAARGDIYAFTDDDVVVDPKWLHAHVDAYLRDASVGAVTGLILPLEVETQAQAWIEQAAGFGKGTERREFSVSDPPPDQPLFPLTAGRLGSGANMSFRADALGGIGGFDAALGAGTHARGGDDLAALYDVVVAGWTVVYEPDAIVWHAHPREYAALRKHAFADGVGLSAYAAHVVSRGPAHAGRVVRQLPRAAAYALSRSSPKNARRPGDYPHELVRRELAGLAVGPMLYARSRWANRDAR